ncbi:hypothetical protein AB0F91_15560 [Amycolatopsis sp. NPDC023774]|uniref:hypothetical protein n=1 Tax=Amycolatopsis sp. NPDC023774 TaxID=3155015 RepID=UPI0033EF35EF
MSAAVGGRGFGLVTGGDDLAHGEPAPDACPLAAKTVGQLPRPANPSRWPGSALSR